MGDDNASKSDGISNSVSLVISILAMLISAGTLYWQFLRGPKLRAYQPNVLYVSKQSIGIPVAFTNEGTSADVSFPVRWILRRDRRNLIRPFPYSGYHPLNGK